MSNVSILPSGTGKILVLSPYHPDFPAKAKRLGGRFTTAPEKGWIFDARDEQRVRELLVKVYGTDGTPVPKSQLLTVRTDPSKCDVRGGGAGAELWLAGRQVARALGRDSGARLGDGVVVVSGGFSSGGSVKNYKVAYRAGTVFELRDVPREAAERVHAEYHGVTLLDVDGNVVAEPTVAPIESLSCDEAAKVRELARLELAQAEAEGRLAGLKFRIRELRAA